MDPSPPAGPSAPDAGPAPATSPEGLQPSLVALLAEPGRLPGIVLDVGCGAGALSLHVAALGRPVLGVDAAASAVAAARERARARGLAASFEVCDPLALGALRRRFETALDCGHFHGLDDAARARYARSLGEAVAPGGVVHLLCVSDAEPPGEGPRRVSGYELRATFRPLFVAVELREARWEGPLHPGGARAHLATLRRM